MPECYAHAAIAAEALMRSGNTVASHPAFTAGANGPDPFFFYHFWSARPRPNLPAMAKRMHTEHTSRLLLALVNYAATPVQQSYVMGYLAHYATDCTLNPCLAAMAAPGMPYAAPGGLTRIARDLDSTLYYRDYKTLKVPVHAGTPVLITDELAQVVTLLRECLWATYEKDIPLLALADAYHDNLSARKLLYSPLGARRLVIGLLARPGASRHGGPVLSRSQPGRRLPQLPRSWQNPATGLMTDASLDEMLALAEQNSAICVTAAMRYWLGQLSEERLDKVLGNNNLYIGRPCEVAETAQPVQLDMPEAGND